MKTKFKESSIKLVGAILINEPEKETIHLDLRSKGKTKSGIYCLRNKLHPERYYIGMARNLETRLQHHKSDLILGKHKSQLLQNDFNQAHIERIKEFICTSSYTFDTDFEMEVIIYCRPSELTFYEHLLISALDPYYNTHKPTKSES